MQIAYHFLVVMVMRGRGGSEATVLLNNDVVAAGCLQGTHPRPSRPQRTAVRRERSRSRVKERICRSSSHSIRSDDASRTSHHQQRRHHRRPQKRRTQQRATGGGGGDTTQQWTQHLVVFLLLYLTLVREERLKRGLKRKSESCVRREEKREEKREVLSHKPERKRKDISVSLEVCGILCSINSMSENNLEFCPSHRRPHYLKITSK